jgi:hypothetical protein
MNTRWILIPLAFIWLWAGCKEALAPEDDPETQIPLAPPEQPSLTPRNERIDVAFTTVATAERYELWYGESPATGGARKWEPGLEVAGRLVSGTITGLQNGIPYYVWTKAVYPYGTSGWSEMAEATPIPPPSTPAPPLVSRSDSGQLELTWTEVAGAESYVIYFNPSGGAVPPENSTREEALYTSFLLQGLEDSRSYSIWLAARNSADESPPSAPVSGTPAPASSPPGAPQGPALATGDERLTLSWAGVPTASSYRLYYNTTGSSPTETDLWPQDIPAALPSVSARIDGLTNGTPYYVWVQAKNSAGLSPLSPSNNSTPHGKPALNLNDINLVVGRAAAEFSTGGDRGWRKKETSIGNLFADSSAWYIRKKYPDEPIDFALLPARVVSSGIPKGNITIGSIRQVQNTASYSYDWSLSIITLTGSQVIDLFSVAADIMRNGGGGHPTGGFHLISSEARHTIDYTTGTDNTHGITRELVIAGNTLVKDGAPTTDTSLLNRSYRIVTMQYLLDGVDDYTYYDGVYSNAANVVKTGIWTLEAMAFYVYDFDEPIQPVIDGRISLIGGVVIP